MNRKGQALVEFVLILPVLIFILLAVVDIGRLMIAKNHLETVLNTVSNTTNSVDDFEYEISIKVENDFIKLKTCIDTYTPGLNKVLGKPACVSTSKKIINSGE